jgi:hypothetical protein
MKYKKKPGAVIECTDGHLKGKKFYPGKVYDEIPEQDKIHFEVITDTEPVGKAWGWEKEIKDNGTE